MLHTSCRIPAWATFTSVALPQPHRGTIATRTEPTLTVMVGGGKVSVSLIVAATALAWHPTATGTASGGEAAPELVQPTKAAATKAAATKARPKPEPRLIARWGASD